MVVVLVVSRVDPENLDNKPKTIPLKSITAQNAFITLLTIM